MTSTHGWFVLPRHAPSLRCTRATTATRPAATPSRTRARQSRAPSHSKPRCDPSRAQRDRHSRSKNRGPSTLARMAHKTCHEHGATKGEWRRRLAGELGALARGQAAHARVATRGVASHDDVRAGEALGRGGGAAAAATEPRLRRRPQRRDAPWMPPRHSGGDQTRDRARVAHERHEPGRH